MTQPRARGAAFIRFLTFVLAVAALVVALLAYMKAGNRPVAVPVPASSPVSTSPVPSPAPSPSLSLSSGPPPSLDAQTQYQVTYTGETLQIPGSCNTSVNVDLDEPRVLVQPAVAEFTYLDPCGSDPAYVTLADGVTGALADSHTATPAACADRIRTSPIAGNQPIQRGQVYCVNTSPDAARNAGLTWKMVILTVTAATDDGVVTLQASAWDIPQ